MQNTHTGAYLAHIGCIHILHYPGAKRRKIFFSVPKNPNFLGDIEEGEGEGGGSGYPPPPLGRRGGGGVPPLVFLHLQADPWA